MLYEVITVVGVDVNRRVLDTLSNGGIHIHEPGLRTIVEAAIKSGKLSVSDKPEEADAFLIAVPTPFYSDKTGEHNGEPYKLADMRAVSSAAEAIVPYLRKGNLVILESTRITSYNVCYTKLLRYRITVYPPLL